jgi:hypothetical protein
MATYTIHLFLKKIVKQILLCKMHMSMPLCRFGLNRATSKELCLIDCISH